MPETDVLVLGRGLGAWAAARSARSAAQDASVHLVAGFDRPFDRLTGLVDVLGTRPDERGPVADPFAAIDALSDDHPYQIFGREALRDGLALFDEATRGTYAGSDTDANALLPTLVGTPTPAARYPAAMADGLASRDDDALLVGIRAIADFHAPLAAERLASADVPFGVEGVTIDPPVDPHGDAPSLAVAEALDANEPIDGRDATVRESLARAVASVHDGQARIGLPAVLGLGETRTVHATLRTAVDADVFEVPLGPPNVPGRRLEWLLFDELQAADVEGTIDVEVAGVETDAGAVASMTFENEHGRWTVEPDAVVLATGGPIAGGVLADRDGAFEPLFDCHVPQPDDRSSWASTDPLGDHAFARFGVRTDATARPLSADGDPEFENLYAAGSVIGGHDAAERSRAGVALASGYVAGTQAVEHK